MAYKGIFPTSCWKSRVIQPIVPELRNGKNLGPAPIISATEYIQSSPIQFSPTTGWSRVSRIIPPFQEPFHSMAPCRGFECWYLPQKSCPFPSTATYADHYFCKSHSSRTNGMRPRERAWPFVLRSRLSCQRRLGQLDSPNLMIRCVHVTKLFAFPVPALSKEKCQALPAVREHKLLSQRKREHERSSH